MENQTRRVFLGKVGAGVTAGALSSVLGPPLRSAAFSDAVTDATSKYESLVRSQFPWMPPVTFIDDMPAGSGRWFTTYDMQNALHKVEFPADLHAPVDDSVVKHESGHVCANYVYNARGPVWSNPGGTGPWDLYVEFLRYNGGDPSLRSRSDINEIFAEHFNRMLGGAVQYPALVGLVPFDATTMRNFVNQIAPPSVDGYGYISPDLALVTDANGNWFGTINISGMYGPAGGQIPILGVAERIGLAGTEASLPDCTFWVPSNANGAWGYLMVRDDPIRSGTAYFRVSAFE